MISEVTKYFVLGGGEAFLNFITSLNLVTVLWVSCHMRTRQEKDDPQELAYRPRVGLVRARTQSAYSWSHCWGHDDEGFQGPGLLKTKPLTLTPQP